MGIRSITRLFNKSSVSVSGMKGTGKDILFANVVARRRPHYYISNVDYKITNKLFKKQWINFDSRLLRVGNDYSNFINNNIKQYVYPYPDSTDIYLSDCGIYFPSQYSGKLDVEFKDIPTFLALSRQLGNCYVHTNCQALGRVWNKIREQSDKYIVCQWCRVLFGKIVFQVVRVYERYDSAEKNIPPCRLSHSILNANAKSNYNVARNNYIMQYGRIKTRLLIYRNKSKYDTRRFKTILLDGVQNA